MRARGPEGHSARHLRVNPAGYGDGDGGYGRQRRPAAQHPASHLLSSARPTYTGCPRKGVGKDR